MIEVGAAVLSILPSAKGFGARLQSETGPEVTRAGTDSGKKFSKSFTDTANKEATDGGKSFGKKFANAVGLTDFAKGLKAGIRQGVNEADAEAKTGGKRLGDGFRAGLLDGLKRNLSRDVGNEVERATKSAAKAADKQGRSAGAVMGTGFKAAIGPLMAVAGAGMATDFAMGLIKDAEESAKVGAKTEAIIKATGGAAKISADQVGALATAISNKTAMDDEMLQTGANMLLTFKNVRNEAGKNNDIFNRATSAAADLSAAGFGSMEGASVMLGKALNDPVKGMAALGRAGIQFTQQQKDQVKALMKSGDTLGAQKVILKEVEGQVGGTAAASATASEKLSVSWGNFREELGAKLLPAFGALVDFTTASVLPMLGQLGDTIATMWNTYAKPALTQLKDFVLGQLVPVLQDFFFNTVLPVWQDFGEIVKQAWETVIRPALTTLWTFIRDVIAPVLLWLWTNVVQPVFKLIWSLISWAVKTVILPVLGWLIRTVNSVGSAFTDAKNWIVQAWGTIMNKSKAAWVFIDAKVLTPLKSGFNSLKGFFGTVVTGVGKVWDGIKDAVMKPIRYVVNDIIRDKLVGAWNAVAEKLGLPKWEFQGFADGGIVNPSRLLGRAAREAGYAAGGWTGPGHTYAPAGVVHADEFVIRKQSQRKLARQAPGFLDYLNTYGEVPGYAGGGMVYQSMAAWIRKNLPGIAITSTYRPGAITATGNRSYHASGRAIDMSPSMGAFNKILATFGPSIAELIFSPAGARQIKDGRPHMYTGVTRAMHFNHVHWAMRNLVGDVAPGSVDGLPTDGSFSIANPIAIALKKLLEPLFGGARSLIDRVGGIFGDNDPAKMATAFAKKPVDAVDKWLHEKIDAIFPPMFGNDTGGGGDVPGAPPGSGVQRWASTVLQALGMVGQPASLLNVVLRRMNQESGGNPTAINNWDINAKRGDPSKGLMQVIGGTFRQYAMPGYNRNIYDPLSNILASMRYAISRYGSLSAAYNRSGGYAMGGLVPQLYDTGGLLPPGLTLVSNQTGKHETVRTAEQEERLREQLASKASDQIVINGVKLDTIGEFSDALSYSLTRQQNRRRFR